MFRDSVNFSDFLSVENEIGAMPFQDKPERQAIHQWCKVNDSIIPNFITSDLWVEMMHKGESMLQTRDDKKKNLNLPFDLNMAEIIPIICLVDQDTFGNNQEPIQEHKNDLLQFGHDLQKHAIYIAQTIDTKSRGSDIAQVTCENMYSYGASVLGEQNVINPFGNLSKISLNDLELKECDQWFFGEKINDMTVEERTKKITQYFRVCDTARKLEERHKGQDNSEKIKFFSERWILTQRKGVRTEMQKPIDELYKSIFRRGIYKLATEIKDKHILGYDITKNILSIFGYDIDKISKTLKNKLNIDQMKIDLDKLRESGDSRKIGNMERSIAKKIQRSIFRFGASYHEEGFIPSVIVRDQSMNCFGFAALGSALFDAVGLKHCIGSVSVDPSEFGTGMTHYGNILIPADAGSDELQIYDMQAPLPINIKARNLISNDGIMSGEDGIQAIYRLKEQPNKHVNLLIQKTHPWLAVIFTPDYFLHGDVLPFSVGGSENVLMKRLLSVVIDRYRRDSGDINIIETFMERRNILPGIEADTFFDESNFSSNRDERIELIQESIKLDPTSLTKRLFLAKEYLSSKKIELCKSELKKIESMAKKSPAAWLMIHKIIKNEFSEVNDSLRYNVEHLLTVSV